LPADASSTAMATESSSVCDTSTLGWHLRTEIKSEYATDCGLRQNLESEKKRKIRS
jgi:hypothetical protein